MPPLVHKLWPICRTGQIGCTVKTKISVLADQPTVQSGGVTGGGSAINGATPSNFLATKHRSVVLHSSRSRVAAAIVFTV